ncbi:MAG: Cytidylyltransferase [Candidatus Magasanikbacteria bacterium GW2011_GWD2_43_18]|uniref:Cytidylyltransferase n=1 Tax=Candidatus Magasanikbacteria bacterium GW2011_GWE2_42_7 TaxID=1619052 RepID=A0A0G1EES9_9BACT|nr:MAG: Cytidylyltransferase [Candidatus Magasanikbacteria bacterium GW2011_GWC2_42_27]KKS73028.1 MAG: Cytidylyltransferase [Candidatus Magasanikbacteria bacterium GW2011_GWE2_42_7]KKT03986.1 MAG: Cytidylyltransferase [Candidatus Magasanikbacteria bacterium GW2011_GWD2_43_18]KKT26003.1 MAG: Cytidylyltransferase [Candidatus Magasanikbacteria bacterium GW2011_GWA2_43_9]HBB37712.1 FAD synthase [Candidatus Magasanikbacteria bacterium]
MKTVLLFGTFDFLHSGHMHTFEEAKKLGDTLIVSVARDKAVETIKAKFPLHSEEERLNLVRHIDIVDDAILGDEEQSVYSFFDKFIPDIIALGYDQDALKEDIETFIATHDYATTCVTLPVYKNGDMKSSRIKETLAI